MTAQPSGPLAWTKETMSPFNHLVFSLSLPLGALALLACPFLLLGWRRQSPLQRASWGGAAASGLLLWLLGVLVTLAGAQHARAPGGHPTLLLGNALVCLGGLVTLYAAFRLRQSRRTRG